MAPTALRLGAAALFAVGWALPLMAQDYPARPTNIIVPATPRSDVGAIAGIVANDLQMALGQAFVVQNRTVDAGLNEVAHARADGYTLLYAGPGEVLVAPFMQRASNNSTYDPLKLFDPIVRVTASPYIVIVNPSVPGKTLKDVAAYAAGGHPVKVDFGLHDNDLMGQLVGMVLNGVRWTAAPRRQGGPSVEDVVSGQAQLAVQNLHVALPAIRSGRVRALAVLASRRDPQLPDVPTMIENGQPDFVYTVWSGLWAPAHTPSAIVAKLNAAINKALTQPETLKALTALNAEPAGGRPEEFGAAVKPEALAWSRTLTPACCGP